MSLDELLKVIKDNTWICVRVLHEDAATEYWYPPREKMYKEWNEYRVLSVEGYCINEGIVIDVEEVNEC